MAERNDTRQETGGPVQEAVFTLLFAVIATVSAVTLVRTLTKPLATGSLSPVQWALFAVTVVGATLGFVRAIRFYASLSVLARLRHAPPDDASDPEAPKPRLHPLVDDLSWAAITLAVTAINVLMLWAVVRTLADLLGETRTPTSWLLWQFAVLIVALAGVVRLERAIVAELRSRTRRRRRNAVHIITNQLIYWPAKPRRSSSSGRRVGRVAAVAAAAVLAGVSWASASGPLLEPAPERAAPAAGAPFERTPAGQGARSTRPANTASRTDRSTPRRRAGATRTRRGQPRSRKREPTRDRSPVAPAATSIPQAVWTPSPTPTAPATREPPTTPTQPERERSNRRERKPRTGDDDRPRSTPTPSPTPSPTVSPAPSPIPSPIPTPTPRPPCGQPPCGVGEGAPGAR